MKNDNIFWITRLRALATFFVILLHVSSPILITFVPEDVSFNWWIGNLFMSFSHFCVPAFLMITGALMFSQKMDLRVFYTKRLKKVILPFIFWSFVYIFLTLFSHYSSLNEIINYKTFKYVLSLLFAGNETSFHLWYVYMIIGIYLFLPILGSWVVQSDNNELLIVLGLWILSILLDYSMIKKFNIQLDLKYFSGYMGYVILGYFLFRIKKNILHKYFGIILTVTGFMITFIGVFKTSLKSGHFEHIMYENLSINIILISSGIFIILKSEFIPNIFPEKTISIVAEYSYGIYLSHILVLNIFSHLGLNWKTFNPLISVPLITFSCIIVSITLLWILKKIPYLNKIVG